MSKNQLLNSRLLSACMEVILQKSNDYVFIKDMSFKYIAVSPGFFSLIDIDSTEEIIGKDDYAIFRDEQFAMRHRTDDEALLNGGRDVRTFIERTPRIDSHLRYCSTTKYLLRDEKGTPMAILGVSRDITFELEMHNSLDNNLDSLFVTSDNMISALVYDITNWRVVDTRTNGRYPNVLASLNTIQSITEQELKHAVNNDEVIQFFKDFTREKILSQFHAGQTNICFNYQRKFSDGSIRWVRLHAHCMKAPLSDDIIMTIVSHDIESAKRERDALVHAATHDALTGVSNRVSAVESIEEYLAQMDLADRCALFMIDIDDFKTVNDTLGHQKGDEALTAIATLIKKTFRANDVVGRLGGDEFIVLMKSITNLRDVTSKALELIKTLQCTCSNQDEHLTLSASAGVTIALYGDSFESLYPTADKALYRAKALGKNQYVLTQSVNALQENIANNAPHATITLGSLCKHAPGGFLVLCAKDLSCVPTLSFMSDSVLKLLGGVTREDAIRTLEKDYQCCICKEGLKRVNQFLHSDDVFSAPLYTRIRVLGAKKRYYDVALSLRVVKNAKEGITFYILLTDPRQVD